MKVSRSGRLLVELGDVVPPLAQLLPDAHVQEVRGQARRQQSVMLSAQGDVGVDFLHAAEVLDVVARAECSHAVGDEIHTRLAGLLQHRLDQLAQPLGVVHVAAPGRVLGLEEEQVLVRPAAGHHPAGHGVEVGRFTFDAVDEHHRTDQGAFRPHGLAFAGAALELRHAGVGIIPLAEGAVRQRSVLASFRGPAHGLAARLGRDAHLVQVEAFAAAWRKSESRAAGSHRDTGPVPAVVETGCAHAKTFQALGVGRLAGRIAAGLVRGQVFITRVGGVSVGRLVARVGRSVAPGRRAGAAGHGKADDDYDDDEEE